MGGLSMDQSFVQAPEHRPKPTVTEAAGIPLIDLSPLASGDAAAVDALAAEVGAASREWGFFLVVGHGVSAGTVARATEAQRAFFALPAERKAAVRRSEAAPLGYYESEHTKNVRDWKEVFDLVAREPPPPAALAAGEVVYENKWTEDLPGFREALEEYMNALEELAFKLLELLARSLNLRPDRLHGFFEHPTTLTSTEYKQTSEISWKNHQDSPHYRHGFRQSAHLHGSEVVAQIILGYTAISARSPSQLGSYQTSSYRIRCPCTRGMLDDTYIGATVHGEGGDDDDTIIQAWVGPSESRSCGAA
ncbi:hypothetical protein C2845_PM02G07460 [Panicum miliaceum]|uniref:Non-haem dioxygenase N-terminal domain-containing protein n=1 Tax=Panicum miliaceum TaxID=4540 RepID=A0A3L6SBP5_PANMI|nr:hypothetical protein C2845_PM02G07460 [Panicum miliaceum]